LAELAWLARTAISAPLGQLARSHSRAARRRVIGGSAAVARHRDLWRRIGGHGPQITENTQNLCDAVANKLGFRISEVALAGEHEIGRDEILVLAGITDRSSLLFLDAARTRARLLANPWISDATVLKLYPDRLRIEIKERQPFALWQKDRQVALIAADGTVLQETVPARYSGLPLVVGKGAEQTAREFLTLSADRATQRGVRTGSRTPLESAP
jgi:hypothetical protein